MRGDIELIGSPSTRENPVGGRVGFDSETNDCKKRVCVRAGPPISGSMIGR